ncbi:MAG TPA: right-handed parallel beta-helix repeat-containing protein [Conexibacter sp.]|jgi:hypothetical protein|nr:right-handed parallel beta-helix repeat-containing protein [Conexibacter sp.]
MPSRPVARRGWLAVLGLVLGALSVLLAPVGASAHGHAHQAQATQLYVATWGQDSWPGTKNLPFRTVARAQQRVRALTAGMHADVVVNLRGGTHTLSAPLQLSAADSGRNGHRVVYQAYGYGTHHEEDAVVSGGQEISGWTLVDRAKNIWRAPAGDLETRQLYVDGRRATRATLAGGIPGNVTATADGYTTDSTAPQSWQKPQDMELVYLGYDWAEARCGIASITGDAHSTTITMDEPCYHWASDLYSTSFTGTLEPLRLPEAADNSPSFLTQPGNFYLDRSHPGHHDLYYIPRAGEDLRHAQVVAPVLESLVQGDGVHDVALRGLTFSYATWLKPNEPSGFLQFYGSVYENGQPPDYDFGLSDQARNVPGNVAFHGSDHVQILDSRFEHLGAQAVEFSQSSSDYLVKGNIVSDISNGGITMGVLQPETTGVNEHNVIEDNWVHDVGVDYPGGVGIFLQMTQDATVAHNQVNDTSYTGISFAGNYLGDTTTHGSKILDNNVFNTLKVLIDGGGIYSSGPQGSSFETGALVQGNVIHDTIKARNIGLYTDQANDWIRLQDNVVYRSEHATGGCSYPPITDLLFQGNFWDDDQTYWACGPVDRITFTGNTLLPREGFEAACAANAACAAIVANAGLEPAYRHLLQEG